MPTKPRTQEIMPLFQKYLKNNDKSLIKDLSIEELEATDLDLGWRGKDESWRMAIRHRIEELKQEKQEEKQKEQNKIADKERTQNRWLGVCGGIIIPIIIASLGWFYFK